ncbi:MAG TPA: zinc ribbon domain-containing protein [Anaerolineales bacterium]|nr:zinc ribbon domain-containing protein [Anaerolineales bacterium]
MKKEIAITAYKCKKCGKIHYPYHDRCLGCKGREFEKIKPEGDVTLLAYTTIFNLPWGFDQRYLILGVAEFENHVKAMGQIKAESVDQLKAGMKMKPSWEPVRVQYGEDVYGLKFEPME